MSLFRFIRQLFCFVTFHVLFGTVYVFRNPCVLYLHFRQFTRDPCGSFLHRLLSAAMARALTSSRLLFTVVAALVSRTPLFTGSTPFVITMCFLSPSITFSIVLDNFFSRLVLSLMVIPVA